MKFLQLVPSLLLTGTVFVSFTTFTRSEEILLAKLKKITASTDLRASSPQQTSLVTNSRRVQPTKEIQRVSEIEHPLKSAQMLLVQSPPLQTAPSKEVVQVTGVKANPTDKGVEVILQTSVGEQLQLINRSSGKSFIADIQNAQLRLPSGDAFTFRSQKPTAGITEITVINQDANTIRVTVIGETGMPTVELFDTDEGLILGLMPVASSTQLQQQPDTQQKPGVDKPSRENPPEKPSARGDEPIELVVTGQADGYSASDATTATRTDTPIRDIPQSIQVVPRQVLEDQGTIRIDNTVRNVSGIAADGQGGSARQRFNIRGFSNFSSFGGGFLRNGFREGEGGFRETANIERIEVLKGPASVLYGNLEPGGVINIVIEQPLRDPFYSGELQIGSYNLYRPSIDLSGPFNLDRTLLYRLNAVYENSDTFRKFDQGIERYFIAPVLTWNIGERTKLNLELDYLNDERPFDRGLVAIGREVADIPITRILGEPDDVFEFEELGVGYRLEHQFSENLTIRNSFRFLSQDTFDYRAEPLALNATTGILSRNFRSNNDILERYSLQTDIVGKFATGAVKHTLLFGVDLTRQTTEGTQRRLPGGRTPSINIFAPVYNLIPRPGLSLLTNVVRDNNSSANTLGIFLQDQIAFADNFKLLLGGRFDLVDQESTNNLNDTTTSQYDEAFTPRIGIVYQPIEPISLYASYSQSFVPNSGIRVDGSILEPTRGTQYEVGIKGEFFNRKLSTALAAYQITKTNIATADLNNNAFVVPVGEQRSRGLELDVVGEILPGWNIIASYAYTDAEVTEDNPRSRGGNLGNQLANVPYNSASLWTTYEIQSGNLKGLGFGIGLFFVGERQGDLENTFVLPSYLRSDAAIFYRQNNWRAAINVNNLFDVKYFEASDFGRVTVRPGAPLTIIGSLSVEF
ncbi:TonB-dependent siderophore receptor [Scytonema sp. NUACC26]|uniref:TonB-dependent siderophore receptor n=1 Tax=Scytonema sp. NUACC26 TaxID=3140176 RepID=UPI0034DC8ABF